MKICPICALVVIVWVAGLFGIYLDAAWANPLIVAMLMGGSVGAVAEKYGSHLGPVWKAIVVILGFIAVYLLVNQSFWPGVLVAILTYGIFIYKLKHPDTADVRRKDLFKDCC